MVIELPRVYYLGYKLENSGEEIYLQESENGLLEAKINKDGIYTLRYQKTMIMKISNITTISTAITLIIICIRLKDKQVIKEE